ncbi:MAG: hypothetical protein GX657_02435, partial [Chloroflexi bacterium]|nr:hypothetical protein [Chloroflexota bacterium]
RFLALIDAVYKVESLTARLDTLTRDVPFSGANEVKVMKLSTVGLGTYSRAAGYPAGDITATWETMQLTAERGRAFSLDRMDNEETLGLVLGNLIREWMRVHVAPELDAYRFAKYATEAGNKVATAAALDTAAKVIAAIDVGMAALDEDEVPSEGRILYISTTLYHLLKASVTRSLATETGVERRIFTLDDMTVVPVPQTRFYTAVDLNAGATSDAGGFAKGASAHDLNFLIVHPSALLQPIKLNQVKYFSPDVNQISDGHLWQYRLYHDAFVYDNRVNGIYRHDKNS